MASEQLNDMQFQTGVLPPEEGHGPWPTEKMTPQVAMDRIRRGLTVENVRIERLKFDGEFIHPVKMTNVVLIRPEFISGYFKEEVIFQGCLLDRPRFVKTNTFRKILSFTGSTLSDAMLNGLIVEGDLSCSNIHAKGGFRVNSCEFKGRVNFWEAQFKGWVDFKKCKFLEEVDFRSLTAQEGFVLNGSHFFGDFLFRGASVAKKWDASYARFEKMVDFAKAKLHDYVYLENIEQGPMQKFSFWNTVGERVQIQTEQLAGRIQSEQAGDFEKAMHEYAFLKRSFSSLHRYEQEDWAFYHFKVNQRKAAKRSWLKPWTKLAQFFDWILLDQGCGYCTNPGRAVRTALVILLGFAMIYCLGFDKFHVDKVPFSDLEKDSWANRIVYSLIISVSVFTSGLSGIKDVAKDWMNIPLIIESLLGTLLWGLFIVAFSRKVIR